MSFTEIAAWAALLIVGMMGLLWLLSLYLRDASIVDMFWGLGFVIINGLYFALGEGNPARKALITVLVLLWGLRLAAHLTWRNLGQPEDYRYRKWREQHGSNWWWRSLFQVFALQGLVMWLLTMPLLAAQHFHPEARLTLLDGLGLLLWSIGFFWEAVGDWQLARFRQQPANQGKVLDSGLWRYSRHPNYFGEALLWWGFYLVALAAGGWWTLFSPLLITFLLLKVSGVAMLDAAQRERKPAYADYMRKTSAFIPLPPKD